MRGALKRDKKHCKEDVSIDVVRKQHLLGLELVIDQEARSPLEVTSETDSQAMEVRVALSIQAIDQAGITHRTLDG